MVQRKELIKPQLLISDLFIYNPSLNKSMYTAFPFTKMNIDDMSSKIINAGLGSALNVEIEWTYPLEDKLSWVKENYSDTFKHFEVHYPANGNVKSKIIKVNAGGIRQNYEMPESYYYNYISPISIDNTPVKIFIPPLILNVIINEINIKKESNLNLPDFVEGPSVKITYFDIKGGKYSINYNSKFEIYFPQKKDDSISLKGTIKFIVSNDSWIKRVSRWFRKSYANFINEYDFNKNR